MDTYEGFLVFFNYTNSLLILLLPLTALSEEYLDFDFAPREYVQLACHPRLVNLVSV